MGEDQKHQNDSNEAQDISKKIEIKSTYFHQKAENS